MFGRKKVTELSEESKLAIVGLREDITTLAELVNGVLDNSQRLMDSLEEIAANGDHAVEEKEAPCGVEPFEPVEETHTSTDQPKKGPPPLREINRGPMTEERTRESPFTRAPRSTQVLWLRREVLVDGQWHTPQEVAQEYANDERHLRYLKAAIAGRMREMHEDRLVERRKSNVRGSMFEYRLPPK